MVRLILVLELLFLHELAFCQKKDYTNLTGFNVTGIPVLNYNSDEGFGYGARASLYSYARGGYNPYFYLIDTQIFFTTGGKKEVFVFFDSPFLFGNGNRFTGEIRYQDNNSTPFYGMGQESTFIEGFTNQEDPNFINEDYYRFGRRRMTAWLDYQHTLGSFRALAGFGINHTDVDLLDGTTFLEEDNSVLGKEGGFTNYLKFGLLYDTRDFEPAPNRGDWIDVVFEWSNGAIASDYSYRRLTLTQRHYSPLTRRLVLAERLAFVKSWGDIPFYQTAFIASTFRIEEGVGGAKSARGLLKNRYLGSVEAFGNLELRWRLTEFQIVRQSFFFALTSFFDFGGAWNKLDDFSLDTFHGGLGGGVHLGWDESFIISIDGGKGEDVGLALYIGIGYLF